MPNLLTRLGSKLNSPMLKAAAQAGSLMCGGDLLSQGVIEKKKLKEVDLKRTLRFGIIGFALIGPALMKWYGFLERRIKFRQPGTMALAKMLTDQFTFAPAFLYGFWWVNGGLQMLPVDEIKQNIRRDYIDVLKANYQLWPAVQIINFWVIPLAQRVLFVQTVALFWNTYLAWKVNRNNNTVLEPQSESKSASDEVKVVL